MHDDTDVMKTESQSEGRRASRVALERATYEDVGAALWAVADSCHWSTGAGAFANVIGPDDRVLVKPNLVTHANKGPWNEEPLYTHPTLIREVTVEALATAPARVLVGDAPLQSCDWDRLMQESGLQSWADELSAADPAFAGVRDFRRTKCVFKNGIRQADEDQVPLSEFVLFDLGRESLLEPITRSPSTFRVTQYDPDKLERTHQAGRHQYLIAREVLDATVVINLPKLKTHKKAGITCALKNLIGINGNKEFLPHHRVGGSSFGGDCYPGGSLSKRALEFTLDELNRAARPIQKRVWHFAQRVFNRISVRGGDELGVEGAWQGNDTIWRTCLDLNRILVYGRADGTMADTPQRRILHVADGITAGQGDGPLAPEPYLLGLLLGSDSPAAMDWVGAYLLGYEPEQIPLVREAFARFRWPIARFASSDVTLAGSLGDGPAGQLLRRRTQAAQHYPIGWLPAVRKVPAA